MKQGTFIWIVIREDTGNMDWLGKWGNNCFLHLLYTSQNSRVLESGFGLGYWVKISQLSSFSAGILCITRSLVSFREKDVTQ